MHPSERPFWRRYVGPLGFLSVLLGVIIAWNQIGLPRPALSYEVEAIMEEMQIAGAYQQDTREMLLRDRLLEKRYQLDRATSSHRKLELERDIALILRQIRDLRGGYGYGNENGASGCIAMD